MISRTTEKFRKAFVLLPVSVKKNAKDSFVRFQENPYHPGLRFKRIHSKRPIYSVRISDNYRAVGVMENTEIIWFWIGGHADYDEILKSL